MLVQLVPKWIPRWQIPGKKTLKQGPRTLFECFFGTELIFSYSKSTIQTLEKGVKYVPS